MDNKEIGEYDKALIYNKVGLSVIYGFQILNTKNQVLTAMYLEK